MIKGLYNKDILVALLARINTLNNTQLDKLPMYQQSFNTYLEFINNFNNMDAHWLSTLLNDYNIIVSKEMFNNIYKNLKSISKIGVMTNKVLNGENFENFLNCPEHKWVASKETTKFVQQTEQGLKHIN